MPSYTIRRDTEIPAGDGCVLRADVWLPEGPGPFPALLERLPYDKSSASMSQHIVGMDVVRALDRGFAVVVQDTRGRFAWDGIFEPFVHEAADGIATIDWICEQSSSNGQVCTFGAPYVGATQMLLAARASAGLLAMPPQLTTSEYYENWTYRGGALQLGFLILWIAESLGPPDAARRALGADEPGRRYIEGFAGDFAAAMARLPVRDDELSHLAPYFDAWTGHPTRDRFWDEVDPSRSFGHVRVPALHIGGWNDHFVDGTLRSFCGLHRGAATARAREGQYLVVGPWSHGNMSDWQGDRWMGYAANAAAMDLATLQLEFFDAARLGRALDNAMRPVLHHGHRRMADRRRLATARRQREASLPGRTCRRRSPRGSWTPAR